MTDPTTTPAERPYTDEDLRAEAARQHADLTEDPDYMGVGEAMEDRYVQSTVIDEDPDFEREGSTWEELLPVETDDGDAYDKARRAIHDLIRKAADVSEWAINLGADGLEPTAHTVSLDSSTLGGDFARLHLAFHPDVPEADRVRFTDGLRKAIEAHL